jgi:hypothetical protein
MSTYASRLRAKLDPAHPVNKSFPGTGRPPPNDDKTEDQFQEDLLDGYRRYVRVGRKKVKNRCERCFTYRSANGSCNCT